MPITQDMLQSLIQKLQSGRQTLTPQPSATNGLGIPGNSIQAPIDATTLAVMGRLQSPAESTAEIAKLINALSFLSSDIERGSGRFYDSSGNALPDYWLAGIWAIASLNWPSGKELARSWSQKSARYTEPGFEKAWDSYNFSHANGIGIGSLYKRAKELGWNQDAMQPQEVLNDLTKSTQRFTLLDINNLVTMPPTEHLVKGILPSFGLAAIYGPSGSGKTFLALDLIMAIACKSDWFGQKVKNVPVTYVGLEGKGGINNRIKAWRIKNPSVTPSNLRIILDNFDLMLRGNVIELANTIIDAQMHQGVIVIDTLNQASPAADENSSHDMGVIIKHLKILQEMTGGLVLVVHHTGKDKSKGLRGHSSLKAALDANIEVVGGIKRSWVLEKSKDGEDGKGFSFRLEVQNLGADADGDPITSCTVERDHSAIFAKPEPSGGQQKVALKAIKQTLVTTTNQRITSEAAVSVIAQTLTNYASNKRNNRARQILGSLTTGSFLSSELVNDEGWVWLP